MSYVNEAGTKAIWKCSTNSTSTGTEMLPLTSFTTSCYWRIVGVMMRHLPHRVPKSSFCQNKGEQNYWNFLVYLINKYCHITINFYVSVSETLHQFLCNFMVWVLCGIVFYMKSKIKRSESVLWQNPLHQRQSICYDNGRFLPGVPPSISLAQ